jgi:hypothetical protein
MNDVCQIEGSILAEDSLAIHYFIYLFKFTLFWDIVEKRNWVKLWLWVFLLFLCLLLTLLNLRCWHSLFFFFLTVLLAIQRRHFEQVKVAVPVILNVLKAVCSEFSARDTECMNLFIRALGIADSIRAICAKLVCLFPVLFSFSLSKLSIQPC